MYLLRVTSANNFIWGVMPQIPDFGAGLGISSLNVQSNIFRKA
jgi:hypothetical protein